MPYCNVILTSTTLPKDNWSSVSNMGQFFFYIVAFIFVMVLAYYSTKWLGKAQNISRGSSNLKVIEGVSVGVQSNVQLVKVGKRYILIGVTKEKITFLTELDENEIVLSDGENSVLEKIPFEKYLSKYFKK